MDELTVWLSIIGIGLITFALRGLPIAALSSGELPDWAKHSLRFVPAAVMMAIITPALFFIPGTTTMGGDPARLLAALGAVLIAWRTRSTLWTVVLGMALLWTLQALLPALLRILPS